MKNSQIRTVYTGMAYVMSKTQIYKNNNNKNHQKYIFLITSLKYVIL